MAAAGGAELEQPAAGDLAMIGDRGDVIDVGGAVVGDVADLDVAVVVIARMRRGAARSVALDDAPVDVLLVIDVACLAVIDVGLDQILALVVKEAAKNGHNR